MLTTLHIRNVVLIDSLTIDFKEGLSALTGETGAGKSILLDSLGLALGARADSALVKKNTEQASVTATFELPETHPAFDFLREQDYHFETPLILRRVLSVDGKSKAYINDEPVSITLLKNLGDLLIDIHGQHETYGLLNPSTHREVMDKYARTEDALKKVAESYAAWKDTENQLKAARDEAARAMENEAYLRASLEELKKVDPQAGEETELLDRKKRLQNREALLETLNSASEWLAGENGADMQLGQAGRALSRHADKIGSEIDAVLASLDRAAIEIADAHRQLESMLRALGGEDWNLEQIEDRLYALRALARKHNCACENLPDLLAAYTKKLDMVDHQDQVLKQLERDVDVRRSEYHSAAKILHEKRVAASKTLDVGVNAELRPLKLEKATFKTKIEPLPDHAQWGPYGMDQIQFVVQTNAGTDFGALNKIASGGEMARFMLALKVVLAQSSESRGVYVFDEIDTGIGGATASAVGARLALLATHHQVMAVTHSPQVAARAGHHYVVTKSDGKTNVLALSLPERREEIARMLAGNEVTHEARAAASKLLETGS